MQANELDIEATAKVATTGDKQAQNSASVVTPKLIALTFPEALCLPVPEGATFTDGTPFLAAVRAPERFIDQAMAMRLCYADYEGLSNTVLVILPENEKWADAAYKKLVDMILTEPGEDITEIFNWQRPAIGWWFRLVTKAGPEGQGGN